MSSSRLKKNQIKSKGKISSKPKIQIYKKRRHKNKKVARREGYPGEANVRSKPESRNKYTQTAK